MRRFTVRPAHRPRFPETIAGSHVLVRHKSGVLRSYSLCGPSDDRGRYQFAVQRDDDGRGGSLAFHQDSDEGDPIHVSYPTPSLPLSDDARKHVFLAGGIGVTPFVALALAAADRGEPATVHYAVRNAEDAAFSSTLGAVPGLDLRVYTSATGTRVDVDSIVSSLSPDAHLYVCGPQRLLDAVSAASAEYGTTDRVHLESFGGLDLSEAHSGEPFRVHLSLSKRDVEVSSSQSLLQALHSADLDVDSSCEGGVCGACRVTLLGGEAIHRDICLSAREREQNIITCVSRGVGTLTLHL
ncbi:oxidoreductase [Microbacteriaceae bacterium VKM Ac-2855]|nr:oxidoreductase [Microbacteriaceae bacterium VKM Ac-2855]